MNPEKSFSKADALCGDQDFTFQYEPDRADLLVAAILPAVNAKARKGDVKVGPDALILRKAQCRLCKLNAANQRHGGNVACLPRLQSTLDMVTFKVVPQIKERR
ncbi:MAG: hypothetical protein ACOYT9_04075 [Patescibacteria group bacterium]